MAFISNLPLSFSNWSSCLDILLTCILLLRLFYQGDPKQTLGKRSDPACTYTHVSHLQNFNPNALQFLNDNRSLIITFQSYFASQEATIGPTVKTPSKSFSVTFVVIVCGKNIDEATKELD
jgi:hypothetical protein